MLILKAESMNKYSTKRTSNNCNSFDSFNKHRRDYSPSRRSHSRNSSPDSWSPRGPSSYSKAYSRSKDRDRDNKYYDGGSKSKYMRLSRSPVGHESSKPFKSSSGHSRESYYENNNHSSSYSSTAPTKRSHFGDWTEQVSSSGKRYFYNSKTETSQWEKPKDWLEWERRHTSKYSSSSSDKYSNNYRDKYDSNSSNPKSYAYSNDSFSSKDKSKEYKDLYNTRHASPSYRSHSSTKTRDNEKRITLNDIKKPKAVDSSSANNNDNYYQYKKAESSAVPLKSTDSQSNILNNSHVPKNDQVDSSKPSVINNNSSSSTNNNNNNNSNNINNNLNSKPPDHGINNMGISNSSSQLDVSNLSSTIVSTLASIVSSGQSSLTLSKLISQLTNAHGINLSTSSLPEDTLLLLKKALNITQKSQNPTTAATPNNNNQVHLNNSRVTLNSPRNSTSVSHHHHSTNSPTNQSKHQSNKSYSVASYRHLNSSEIRQDLDQISKQLIQSPTSSGPESGKSALSNCRNDSTSSSGLSTISSVMTSTVAQKNPVPNLSRFKHLYREDLVGHVLGWPSETFEKSAAAHLDQANQIGNHLCTRVSSDLKNARSLVRLKEIQTTLQKQRILFASQQIKSVEDWKGKQFSNYS